MQWAGIRRAFPLRTGLLMCSIPALALAAIMAWFRWELPPLEGYYLRVYWESSKSDEHPENTTQIQWLYKATPGRQSEPVIRQDVDSNGSGFLPIGLSSFARERGWTQLVKMPVQRWKSFELASFLQEDFYGNRTFREVILGPLFTICVIPFLVLFVVVIMRQELAAEWRGLYEEVYGDEFTSDWRVFWRQFKEQIRECKYRFIACTKANLSNRQSDPTEQIFETRNEKSFHAEADKPLRSDKPVVLVAAPTKPKHHAIFPGAAAVHDGNVCHLSRGMNRSGSASLLDLQSASLRPSISSDIQAAKRPSSTSFVSMHSCASLPAIGDSIGSLMRSALVMR